jgi:D-methionine transport system ATP-binding protein
MTAPVNLSSSLATAAEALASPPSAARREDDAITLSGVTKTYPARDGAAEVFALHEVELAVPRGRILGVIGPSGAGKSTLIRLVNGLERPSRGSIRLFGREVTSLSEGGWRLERRRIGMVFQHFNLLSSRTAFDNIALPLEIAGVSRGEIDRRVTDLLELVGLTDKRLRYPAELSGGQKQRVGIARALATEPAILLCDEATSALDPETTRSILQLLKRINRELGVTILLITHEIPVIKEICDEVAVIENGQIVEAGSVFDVLTQPAHPTTARFVEGVTNVEIPAYLRGEIVSTRPPGGLAVLRVGFAGEHATTPVISRLSTTLGLDLNILAGRIDAIGERPFGSLIVAVPGDIAALGATLAALHMLRLTVEQLGYIAATAAGRDVSTREEVSHVA